MADTTPSASSGGTRRARRPHREQHRRVRRHAAVLVPDVAEALPIMDFVNGGHLFFWLYRQGLFDTALTRPARRELTCAIGHLHSLNVVLRLPPVEHLARQRGPREADGLRAGSGRTRTARSAPTRWSGRSITWRRRFSQQAWGTKTADWWRVRAPSVRHAHPGRPSVAKRARRSRAICRREEDAGARAAGTSCTDQVPARPPAGQEARRGRRERRRAVDRGAQVRQSVNWSKIEVRGTPPSRSARHVAWGRWRRVLRRAMDAERRRGSRLPGHRGRTTRRARARSRSRRRALMRWAIATPRAHPGKTTPTTAMISREEETESEGEGEEGGARGSAGDAGRASRAATRARGVGLGGLADVRARQCEQNETDANLGARSHRVVAMRRRAIEDDATTTRQSTSSAEPSREAVARAWVSRGASLARRGSPRFARARVRSRAGGTALGCRALGALRQRAGSPPAAARASAGTSRASCRARLPPPPPRRARRSSGALGDAQTCQQPRAQPTGSTSARAR